MGPVRQIEAKQIGVGVNEPGALEDTEARRILSESK